MLFRSADGGFWFDYASREGRPNEDVALVQLSATGAVLSRTWIAQTPADEGKPQLANFDGALLAGWTAGGARLVERLDAAGNPVGSPQTLTAAAPFVSDSDWISRSDGDVVWSFAQAGALQVARFRACGP